MPYGTNNPPGIPAKLLNILSLGVSGAVDGTSDFNRQKSLQMQAAIEQQKRDAEAEREYANQAEALGVTPVRDANGKVNRIATAAAVQRMQGALEDAKQKRELANRNAAALNERAAAVNVDPNAGGMPSLPQGFSFGQSQAIPPAQAPKPLQARVAEAEAKAKQDEFDRQKSLASQTTLATGRAATAAKEIEEFRKTFGRDPGAAETTDEGFLNASALGTLRKSADKIASGFRANDNGGWDAIPGGPADLKQQAEAAKVAQTAKSDEAKKQMLSDTTTSLLDNIKTALPLVGMTTAGNAAGGSLMRNIPFVGQNAQDLHAALDSIQSGLGVNMLNEMRSSSGNGTTGIGRIMQVEFEAFAKAARNLNQEQSPAQLKQNLTDLQTHLMKWQEAHQRAQAEGAAPATGAPSGAIKINSIKQVSP